MSSSTSTTSLSLSCETEKLSIAHNKTLDSFLCVATLKAPVYEPDEKRPGMDITAVLDRSGSMSGAKMTMLHKTVGLMIDNLKSTDRLSLVAYDDTVETPLPLTAMDSKGKEIAKRALASITDRGMTNLSGGLLAGLDVLDARQEGKNEVSSVLLMTDGLANKGVTGKEALVKLTAERMSSLKNPTTLYTFGYGKDHDGNLLAEMAAAGKGNYYFMETADSIASAFGDCLGGLMSVVAQNISIRLTAADNVTIKKVSTTFPVKTEVEKREMVVDVGDIFSEEQRDILVELTLPALAEPTTTQPLLTFELNAFNVVSAKPENHQSIATLERTAKDAADGPANEKVDEQRNRIRTAEALDEARRLGDAGQLRDAQQLMDSTINAIDNSFSGSRSAPLSKELRSLREQMQSQSMYNDMASKKMASKARKHWVQRGAECMDVEEDVYINKSKATNKAAFASFMRK